MSHHYLDYPCEICGGPIRSKPGARQRLTCGDVCRQRKCRNAKENEGRGACRAFTWEMIRGSGGGGVVVKTDTASGLRYLARKERDQRRAVERATGKPYGFLTASESFHDPYTIIPVSWYEERGLPCPSGVLDL
jgi:hypothetical protein